MIFYPKLYVDTIKDVSYEILEKNNIHAIILDMDNTLIDYNANILERCKRLVWKSKTKRYKIFNCFK